MGVFLFFGICGPMGAHRHQCMDGGWTGNIFPLGFSSLANHHGYSNCNVYALLNTCWHILEYLSSTHIYSPIVLLPNLPT
jgi:tellurite resistance protein TehA-like permease